MRAPGNTHRPNASGKPTVPGGIGPGNQWFDPSVFKAEFRIDAFNATNRPQFANPNGVFGNPRFGQITTTLANTERVIKFGLRVLF